MWYLSQVAPAVEIYSIDEAFLDLHGLERFVVERLDSFAHHIRAGVLARTGIPTFQVKPLLEQHQVAVFSRTTTAG